MILCLWKFENESINMNWSVIISALTSIFCKSTLAHTQTHTHKRVKYNSGALFFWLFDVACLCCRARLRLFDWENVDTAVRITLNKHVYKSPIDLNRPKAIVLCYRQPLM